MKKLKNLLIYVVSLALVVCAAVAGTVAYLTYEDSDVNVMTLGNVEIEQIEQQRGENGLEDFEDNKPLLYTFSLAVMLLANYFIGYMICIACAFYFLIYVIYKYRFKINESGIQLYDE